MLELLFLLLPIAAGYGWYMGRRSIRQAQQQQSNRVSSQYVTGLNFLLSDQPDKAVDLFIELLEVDSDTIDTHLALGNLFRQRGEVERAIRIHQNLIARTSLTAEQRNLARMQLGKDFLTAGLLDRAEGIFTELLEEPEHEHAARQQLVQIYQQTKEWQAAINVASSLVRRDGDRIRHDMAHFYCELAEQAVRRGEEKVALGLLKKAIGQDRNCVRANMIAAKVLMDQKQWGQAVKHLEHVLQQDPDFVCETLDKLTTCFESGAINMQTLIPFLEQALQHKGGVSVTLLLADLTAEREGLAAAEALVHRQLLSQPTMKGFHKLMEYHIREAEEGKAKESLTLLQDLVAEQIKIKPKYRCQICGFSTHTLFWLCPTCKSWGSIKPIRGLDGE